MRRLRMQREERVLGAGDAKALQVVVLGASRSVLARRNRQPGRREAVGVHVAAIGRHPTHADQALAPSDEHLGDAAQPPIRRDRDAEGAAGERVLERVAIERVGVDVLDLRRDLGHFVATRMTDHDIVTALEQPPHDVGARGPRSTDHQRLESHSAHCRRIVAALSTRCRRVVDALSCGWANGSQ